MQKFFIGLFFFLLIEVVAQDTVVVNGKTMFIDGERVGRCRMESGRSGNDNYFKITSDSIIGWVVDLSAGYEKPNIKLHRYSLAKSDLRLRCKETGVAAFSCYGSGAGGLLILYSKHQSVRGIIYKDGSKPSEVLPFHYMRIWFDSEEKAKDALKKIKKK